MDDKNLLMVVLAAVVGIIIVIAVLAAGCMLVSVLFDNSGPGASPTPVPTMPAVPTLVPSYIVPSGPFIPTTTPSSSAGPVIPTPVQPQVKSASLAGYGTDKDSYNKNDTAIVYITIKNTGNVVITDAQLNVNVAKYFSMIGYQSVENPVQPLTGLNIQPGDTQNVTYDFTIPGEYEGISTSGDYQFTVDVYVWDQKIGTFMKQVKVL